jgi:hypothetical protein
MRERLRAEVVARFRLLTLWFATFPQELLVKEQVKGIGDSRDEYMSVSARRRTCAVKAPRFVDRRQH